MTCRLLITLCGCWIVSGAVASDNPEATTEQAAAVESADLIVVVGASGAEEFQTPFREAAECWLEVGRAANAMVELIGQESSDQGEAEDDAENDYKRLHAAVEHLNVQSEQPLWIVLIGHGTYAADIAKFNLAGPDFSARELSEWLGDIQRPVVIINGASASGPFINRLSAPGRVIVTATQSGAEQNYARFGEYFAKAIGDLDADIDHDDAVSVLEAFLHAAAATQEFYDAEGRLATEHALLDDNGDGLGTPADFFRGVRAVKSPGLDAEVDGEMARRFSLRVADKVAPLTAQQQKERDRLEQQIRILYEQKETLNEDDYFEKFHSLALKLAKLYQDAEASHASEEDEPPQDEAGPATDKE